jgi:SAM-dependent methyltransferase
VDLAECPSLFARACSAWTRKGASYARHKVLRRLPSQWPALKRRLLYADPRRYWTLRGGDDYFREQEGQAHRSERSHWLAERVARYQPESILEIGCGYGKQLLALRQRTDAPMVGLDFSPTQLAQAREHLKCCRAIDLVLGSGTLLPFGDKAFDLVLTSAVILHNPPPAAEQIRREILRVARRWAAHNEDTDRSYNRYGYDTAAWYRAAGVPLAESGEIPVDLDPSITQFCVAALWPH